MLHYADDSPLPPHSPVAANSPDSGADLSSDSVAVDKLRQEKVTLSAEVQSLKNEIAALNGTLTEVKTNVALEKERVKAAG